MARGKKGVDNLNETLSTEKPEVQNELLKDLINENNNEENQDNPGSNANNVRPDGVACIECLTHVFNVKLADLEKVN